MNQQHVTHTNDSVGRGNQLISARILTVKIDFAGIVRELRKFKFPQLWTLDDVLRVCGLSTNADRVHISRALRRAGIAPVRGKKISLTDIVTNTKIRSYIWHIGNSKIPHFKADRDVRRAYYAERARRAQSVNAVRDVTQRLA